MARLLVKDLMTARVSSLRPDDDLATLYDLMESHHVRHVPIVDEEGELVGLVSNRDLLRSALNEEMEIPYSIRRDYLKGIKVETIMSTAIETVEPDGDICDAAQIMLENKFSCVPVVEGSHLVGILTESDFVRYLSDSLSQRMVMKGVRSRKIS